MVLANPILLTIRKRNIVSCSPFLKLLEGRFAYYSALSIHVKWNVQIREKSKVWCICSL